MRQKVITLALGQMVLDNVIQDYQDSHMNKDQSSLSIGGPPSFIGILGLNLSKTFPWLLPPLIYAYSCPKVISLLKNFSDYDLFSKNLKIRSECPNFRLVYSSDKTERTLSLKNPPSQYNMADFNWKVLKNPKTPLKYPFVAIVSSVYHEFTNNDIFSFLRNLCSYVAFDPQGCFRQLTTDGKIVFREWWDSRIVENVDCLKVSETESKFLNMGTHIIDIVSRILLETSVSSVLLTRGKRGAILGVRNPDIHIYNVPAFSKSVIIDETGAGDLFLFTYVAHYSTFKRELDAVAFATSVTSFFLEQKRFMERFTKEAIHLRQEKIRSNITEFLM